MKKYFKIVSVFALMAFAAVSCIEDDGNAPVVTENPFALTAMSDVTVQLEALSSGQIDCLEMIFPVTVATYTEGFVINETFTFNNSTELIAFFNSLGDTETYAIQYPFTITANGQTLDITGNENFIETLETQIEVCNTANACDTENTIFAQAYNGLAPTEQITMDTWTHEYTFSLSQAGTVCSIGYMGETATLEYTIELIDDTSTVLYTGQHTFNNTEMEYISIPEVALQANTNYTIRRSIQGYGPGSSGIGPLKWGTVMLPLTQGIITIYGARFYGGGGSTDPNYDMLPNIDFVFKPQQ